MTAVGCKRTQFGRQVLDGYSACVFAYGQTGSGKTYTVEGGRPGEPPGLAARAVADLFRVAAERGAVAAYQFRVRRRLRRRRAVRVPSGMKKTPKTAGAAFGPACLPGSRPGRGAVRRPGPPCDERRGRGVCLRARVRVRGGAREVAHANARACASVSRAACACLCVRVRAHAGGWQLSYMEIYNDQIRDLLEPRDAAGEPKRLEVPLPSPRPPPRPPGRFFSR